MGVAATGYDAQIRNVLVLVAILAVCGVVVVFRTREQTLPRTVRVGGGAGEGKRPTVSSARPRTGPAVLEGIVVDVRGAPVAGVEVTVDESDPPRSARSDARGRFAIPARRAQSMFLLARHPDYRLSTTSVAPDDAEPIRVVIERGAPLTVIVRGPDGPVEGAVVDGTARAESLVQRGYYYDIELDEAVTDAQGIARLGNVAAGWLQLRAQKRGLVGEWTAVEAPDLAPRTIELALVAGGTVEGTVRASDGAPVAEARLYRWGAAEPLATTDGAGRYRVTAIDSAGIRLVACAQEYGPGAFGTAQGWGEVLRIRPKPDEVVRGADIVLGAPSWVRGRVQREDGTPEPDVLVTLEVKRGVAHAAAVRTGADGRFSLGPFTAYADASFSLELEKRNFGFFGDTYSTPIAPGGEVDVGIVLANPKARVVGRVYDVDGSALAEGYVNVGSREGAVRDGAFVVEGVYALKSQVVAYGFGPARWRSLPVTITPGDGETATVELRLVETHAITGRIMRTNGEADAYVSICAKRVDATGDRFYDESDVAGPDGRFELPGLLPGRYRVALYRWDGEGNVVFRKDPPVQVVDAGARDLRFRTPIRGGTITGRAVARRSKRPLRQLHVSLLERVFLLPKYRDETYSDHADGSFRIRTAKPGTFLLDVWAEGYATFRTRAITIKRGASVDIGTVALGEPGSVRGIVQDHRGAPVAWSRVYLLSAKLEGAPQPPTTKPDGRYEVRDLSPGIYTLFALSPRHPLSIHRRVTVAEGAHVILNISLPASAPLTLFVTDDKRRPIPGARLVWTFPDLKPLDSSMLGKREPPSYGANISDAQGLIRKPFLPAGNIELLVAAKGHAPVRRTITLRAGEAQRVEIVLRRQ